MRHVRRVIREASLALEDARGTQSLCRVCDNSVPGLCRTGGGRADGSRAIGRAATRIISPSGIACDWTSGTAGYAIAGPARTTGNRVARTRSTAVTAADTSGIAAASGIGSTPAAVKPSTTAAEASATTAASARQGIIWNQTRGHQDGRCEADQTVSNHGILPTLEFRVPSMTSSSNGLQH